MTSQLVLVRGFQDARLSKASEYHCFKVNVVGRKWQIGIYMARDVGCDSNESWAPLLLDDNLCLSRSL